MGEYKCYSHFNSLKSICSLFSIFLLNCVTLLRTYEIGLKGRMSYKDLSTDKLTEKQRRRGRRWDEDSHNNRQPQSTITSKPWMMVICRATMIWKSKTGGKLQGPGRKTLHKRIAYLGTIRQLKKSSFLAE